MNTLSRYLMRLLGPRLLFILSALVIFIISVDVMISIDDIMADQERGGFSGVLSYTLLRVPESISKLLGPSMLLALLATVAMLMRNHEMVALWGSRISPTKTVLALLPVGLLAAALNFVVEAHLAPAALKELNDWGIAGYGKRQTNETREGAFWLRSGRDIVRLPRLVDDIETLDSLTIFRRDDQGRLIERLDATGIHNRAGLWVLEDVTRYRVQGPSSKRVAQMPWTTELPLNGLGVMAAHPSELTFKELFRFVRDESFGLYPPHLYKIWLHSHMAAATTPLLLIALIVFLAQTFQRGGGLAMLVIKGLGFGFGYFILAQLNRAVGEANLLPPAMAAWAAPAALLLIIGTIAINNEAATPSSNTSLGGGPAPGPGQPLGLVQGTEGPHLERRV